MTIPTLHDEISGKPIYTLETLPYHLKDHYTDKLNTLEKVYAFIGKRIKCQDVTDGHWFTGTVERITLEYDEFCFELSNYTEDDVPCKGEVPLHILNIIIIYIEEV